MDGERRNFRFAQFRISQRAITRAHRFLFLFASDSHFFANSLNTFLLVLP